jgi:hypothetical protein
VWDYSGEDGGGFAFWRRDKKKGIRVKADDLTAILGGQTVNLDFGSIARGDFFADWSRRDARIAAGQRQEQAKQEREISELKRREDDARREEERNAFAIITPLSAYLDFFAKKKNNPMDYGSGQVGTIHRRCVLDALIQGRNVPAEVLAEYPDMADASQMVREGGWPNTPGDSGHPWSMPLLARMSVGLRGTLNRGNATDTLQVFMGDRLIGEAMTPCYPLGEDGRPPSNDEIAAYNDERDRVGIAIVRQLHHDEVAQALDEGHLMSPYVLAEYPDLLEKAKSRCRCNACGQFIGQGSHVCPNAGQGSGQSSITIDLPQTIEQAASSEARHL